MAERSAKLQGPNGASGRDDVAQVDGKGDGAQWRNNAPQSEMVRIADLRPYPNNPRKHTLRQRRALKAAIRRFGFIGSILIDAENGIVCGQLRAEIAGELGYDEIPAGRVGHLSEADLRAFMIADNRIAELAEWDPDRLKTEFEYLLSVDYDIELTGFESPEIDFIVGAADPIDDPRADQVPPLDDMGPPISLVGDLWRLGTYHRLICGNALDSFSYATLMAGDQAQMVFTDPPYNVPIDGHVCGLGRAKHDEFVMASGEMTDGEFVDFLYDSFSFIRAHVVDGAVIYICMDWRHIAHVLAAGHHVFDDLLNLCIWNKSNGGMGSLYRSKHECVPVFKKGRAPHINNVELGKHGRNRTNVWDYPSVNAFDPERHGDLELHPTVKPVAMVADAMLDCSKPRGIILDSFVGSGTLFIAAEKTERIGYGIELDPRYVDVTIRRWQKFTGCDAVHAETGLSFMEIAASRLRSTEIPDADIEEKCE